MCLGAASVTLTPSSAGQAAREDNSSLQELPQEAKEGAGAGRCSSGGGAGGAERLVNHVQIVKK